MKTRVISTTIASSLLVLVACTQAFALQLQNGANQLQREDYEPIVTDFLVRYLDDRKPTISDTQKVAGTNGQSIVKRTLDSIGGSSILRSINSNGRFLRNLDHIGGGNLVRDLAAYETGAKRNLDHIGGGNLVRSVYEPSGNRKELTNTIDGANLIAFTDLASLFKSRNAADDRTARNLDQIGGGNLVRSSNTPSANLLRNLDQIGGGNLVRNLDPIGGGNLVRTAEGRNLDGIGGGHLLRQTRRGYDFYPGLTYGENKPYYPLRRSAALNARAGDYEEIHPLILERFGKRNIDEIDGNAFDSFYKRNFDEIDRVGWSGFVKRLSNYPTKQQQQRQQQQQR